MKKLVTSMLAVIAVSAMTNSQAARIIDEASHKAVNNVSWHKVEKVSADSILQASMPDNTASVFFIRRADQDTIQTSANIAINDRFQASVQPGNYSHVYACAGISQISAEITGHKHNDLLKNYTVFNLAPKTVYFLDIDVNDAGNATVRALDKEVALALLKDMPQQTHQLSRVTPNCSPAALPLVAPSVLSKPLPSEPALSTSAPPQPASKPSSYDNIELKVRFDHDKSFVKPQYYEEIKRVSDFMKRYPSVTATIEGHTDSNASDTYNLKLSQRRVDALKKVLINTYGIDASRLISIGYGESRPIASNATAEGREKNRRVVAVFAANE